MSISSDIENEDEDAKQDILYEDEDEDINNQANYQAKFITRNGRRYNITFMDNQLKKRNNPPNTILAKYPKTGSKVTPPLWYKKILIDKLHSRTGSVKDMRNECKDDRNGYKKYLAEMALQSLQRYCADYKKGSGPYLQLEKYIAEHTITQLLNEKRFYFPPNEVHYGLMPILEEYIVTYRNIIAQSSQNRSRIWMKDNMKFILSNSRLKKLLIPLMKPTERKLLPHLKISYSFIQDIQVWLQFFYYNKLSIIQLNF